MKKIGKIIIAVILVTILLVGTVTVVRAGITIFDRLFNRITEMADNIASDVEFNEEADTDAIDSILADAEAELEAYKQQLVEEAMQEIANNHIIQGLEEAKNNAVGQGKIRIEQIIEQRKQENMEAIEQAIMEYLSN